MNDILTTASQNSSGNKTIYQSRPKLKVWNSDIKNALKEKRITYNEWQKEGDIPTILKIGLLSPVFKNKGSKNDALNYRGITILPVESKIIEAIIRDRIQPKVQKVQNPTQRGFTKGSSPMNAALPVEEMYRILPEKKQNGYLVLLDAKAAFDTVVHSHLFRRVYHAGIQDRTWTIIRSLHQNAESSIKWSGKASERFHSRHGCQARSYTSTLC
ncbi:Hypothetical predicted protein [Mytilus galloprovincialis]|uniref:Reverse transcriptase domain-containing protein n=1 Tax=Mytilus galloprovincialis TaxID=29158 RepID=A0A8B6DR00_MYTGA|nr:Hypothetical predicted protein [Mytilus galloprovincialis]